MIGINSDYSSCEMKNSVLYMFVYATTLLMSTFTFCLVNNLLFLKIREDPQNGTFGVSGRGLFLHPRCPFYYPVNNVKELGGGGLYICVKLNDAHNNWLKGLTRVDAFAAMCRMTLQVLTLLTCQHRWLITCSK